MSVILRVWKITLENQLDGREVVETILEERYSEMISRLVGKYDLEEEWEILQVESELATDR